jgi:hypothetical protein
VDVGWFKDEALKMQTNLIFFVMAAACGGRTFRSISTALAVAFLFVV